MHRYDLAKLKAELIRDEGRRIRPYRDSLGIWTVAVGWNLEARGLPPGISYLTEGGAITTTVERLPPETCIEAAELGFTLTDGAVDKLLCISIEDAVNDAEAVVPGFNDMSDARQRVFINMAFNLGRDRLAKFKKMANACRLFNWEEASRQMLSSKWAGQVGARADRLAAMVIQG